eukprot:CAMPEP_0181290020 /NCGR_PEP_ID=MMETSP1101-20121128/1195_1 /TAXON_ID=46948 /ORGANISM="Rhodomonas abbreviata, Strain Caron Lab Isolate" /LENGTH=108 /DNA_ID=CAMNT_0023394285 /DNA_START=43 /DNA_END=367 /DNA_ORIENTATION=-
MPARASASQGTLRMINPIDVARQIMVSREEVLAGWKEWLASGACADHHTEIQRELLLRSLQDRVEEDEGGKACEHGAPPTQSETASLDVVLVLRRMQILWGLVQDKFV